jgi:OPA family sugar phosphate sensor protein UhpC-like MFS transporter
MSKAISPEMKKWRVQIFALTWLAYFGMYFCRKNFSVVMPVLSRELHTSKAEFAIVMTVYSLMYMIGQFLNGYLSDRHGPRLIVGIGLLLSVIANLMMGWMGTLGSFLFLMGLNGFGQSSGWSGLIKNLTPWFKKKERGVMMSFWTTCYVIGGMAATAFATYWLTNQNILPELNWKRAFLIPAVILLIISLIYIVFVRNSPVDIGLEPFEINADTYKGKRKEKEAHKAVLKNGAVWVAAAMYFFVKFTRYAFLFWLPLYLSEALHYSDQQAGYTSIAYEAFGFFGILAAGFASDYLFKSRRFPISSIMLFGLAFVLYLQPHLSPLGVIPTIISIGLIGFFTYGPDSIMSGAAAMDMGKNHGAALAAGLINGVGSAGQLISPIAVAYVSGKYGWDALFELLVIVALIAALLLILKWNYGKENQQNEFEITGSLSPELSPVIK